jgi:dCTP deaminase
MILSNTRVHAALDSKDLIIDPQPEPRTPQVGSHCPYDTHSVDLRLSDEISVPSGGKFSYDTTQPGSIAKLIADHSKKYTLTDDQPFNLDPSKFVLGRTMERIHLPIKAGCEHCLAARIEGKSSLARLGLLVHFTAPTIHPGFEGTITLEIINLGPARILLVPGMYIAQLIVEQVLGCPQENPSTFQGQRNVAGLPGNVQKA